MALDKFNINERGITVSLEKMNDFFTTRVEGYDEHMRKNVKGCKEGYVKMAKLIPENAENLLDLGCGTGLELDEIFKIKPYIKVTGIDLTKAMLDKLKQKHSDKSLTLINDNYFNYKFSESHFDVAVSFQTMHHFSHHDKINLYTKVYHALKSGGQYIECDYMVLNQKEEDYYYSENSRIRKELNINENEFYHYDTPCTINNQINMLYMAGFKLVKKIWREENTTLIIASK